MSDQLWALLWSKRQNCIHVEPLTKTLAIVRQAYRDDRELNDYQVLHVGPRSEVDQTAEAIRPTITARDMERAQQRKAA